MAEKVNFDLAEIKCDIGAEIVCSRSSRQLGGRIYQGAAPHRDRAKSSRSRNSPTVRTTPIGQYAQPRAFTPPPASPASSSPDTSPKTPTDPQNHRSASKQASQ